MISFKPCILVRMLLLYVVQYIFRGFWASLQSKLERYKLQHLFICFLKIRKKVICHKSSGQGTTKVQTTRETNDLKKNHWKAIQAISVLPSRNWPNSVGGHELWLRWNHLSAFTSEKFVLYNWKCTQIQFGDWGHCTRISLVFRFLWKQFMFSCFYWRVMPTLKCCLSLIEVAPKK